MNDLNPYAPPVASTEMPVERTRLALYSPRLILVSSVVFTPLMGGILAWIDWRRLGDGSKARNVLLAAIGCFAIILTLGAVTPDSASGGLRGVVIGASYGVGAWFRNDLRKPYDHHIGAGGKKASALVPVLIGVVAVVAVVALVVMAAESGKTPD